MIRQVGRLAAQAGQITGEVFISEDDPPIRQFFLQLKIPGIPDGDRVHRSRCQGRAHLAGVDVFARDLGAGDTVQREERIQEILTTGTERHPNRFPRQVGGYSNPRSLRAMIVSLFLAVATCAMMEIG